MHDSVKNFVAEELERLKLDDPWIVEIGSRDVNGSVRELFPDSTRYAGLDIQPGPGVDFVTSVEHWPIDSTDLCLCTEMLEHDRFPWKTLIGIYEILHHDGIFILTTRAFTKKNILPYCPAGAGCWHEEHAIPNAECYPMHELPDYWRFTKDGLHWLLNDIGFRVLTIKDDPYMPGVFITARKP